MADSTTSKPDYGLTAIDLAAFRTQYETEFAKVPKFNSPSIPDLEFIVEKIKVDGRITDVRSAAYMLATVFIESSHTVKVAKQIKDRKGNVKTVILKQWRNFVPVGEAGKGRGLAYGFPVKVAKLDSGSARITEYDGDQWELKPSGVRLALIKTAKPGLKTKNPQLNPIYDADDGDEQLFYGRGYVQLTWWFNYAAASVALGRGIEFVFNPELVTDASTAYSILATGMHTGKIFANNHRLGDYFDDTQTDYFGARDMVNAGAPKSNKQEVADIAKRFERILMTARVNGKVASR